MNDFIKKNAQVLLYRYGVQGENPYPVVVTVTKVFTRTLFGLRTLTSVPRSSYAITATDSELAATLWERHYRETAKSAAMAAADAWNTGHGRGNLALLDAAITALNGYRALLVGEQS